MRPNICAPVDMVTQRIEIGPGRNGSCRNNFEEAFARCWGYGVTANLTISNQLWRKKFRGVRNTSALVTQTVGVSSGNEMLGCNRSHAWNPVPLDILRSKITAHLTVFPRFSNKGGSDLYPHGSQDASSLTYLGFWSSFARLLPIKTCLHLV